MNGVYGFHSLLLDLGLPSSVGDRRSGFGIKLAQKDGLATRGRLEGEVSERRLSEVEYARLLRICCRVQDAHMLDIGRRALEGAIVRYAAEFPMPGRALMENVIAKRRGCPANSDLSEP